MRTVSAKLDGETHRRLLELCNGKGCNVNEFLKERINQALDSPDVPKEGRQERPVTAQRAPEPADDRKYHPGYCRGYHVDPETGFKILSRPARVATEQEIKEMTLKQ